MNLSRPGQLSATEAARAISDGFVSSAEVVEACLRRVHEIEADIHAWVFIDHAHALDRARARDAERQQGYMAGPLHGVAVGVADNIETADMPTAYGSTLYAGHTPRRDAAVVSMLRAAGAVILGKTTTTEFATRGAGIARNPHDRQRTAGGASGGAAAAVAAEMVPAALAGQSNDSLIAAAAWCGVYALKPTRGLVPRTGVLRLSRTLDEVGVLARTLDDIALVAEQLVGYDAADCATRPRARIPLVATSREAPPLPPLFGFVKGPAWERASAELKEAFAELVAALGPCVVEVALPESVTQANSWHRAIVEAEIAASLADNWEQRGDAFSLALRESVARGRELTALAYQRALARIPAVVEGFDDIFARCDALLAVAAEGVAPAHGNEPTDHLGLHALWALCGMPAVNLPLMRAENGLPIGVQLIGMRGADARLLRTARWLIDRTGCSV
jgi:Asp-tRNA(Asn)/Glu-tRNA(Gln) amidotransferase A subunit family amidase